MNGLVVEGLSLRRGAFALGPVDLTVGAGTATVLLGPSGAGKTTLLRVLAGFLAPHAGTVSLAGAPVEALPPERRGFGFVPPGLGLFAHRRVRDNVAYPLRLAGAPDADARAREWMERFGLLDLADRYPLALSSGQRQRVAMPRALAARPRALLWDEPLAALDVDSRDGLVRLLREILETEALPLLLVTHDPGTAVALGERVVLLEGGTVRYAGSLPDFFDAPLDRFTARFLGFENVLSRSELESARTSPLASALLDGAGPGGVAVSSEAFSWRDDRSEDGAEAVVIALHRTPSGWSVALRSGGITVHAMTRAPPRVRPNDTLWVRVDRTRLRRLEESGRGG
jgi:ABC-type Fe3+/spermidine/putrescine transport system ATPase subunit